jgi:pyruvate dehydrogenase E2 component (dihydrolipoamide acetyltransferase)
MFWQKRVERLDYAERWMRNGIEACASSGFALSLEADMTGCRRLIDGYGAKGIRVTYTHLFVRAAAVALEHHPDICQIVSGSLRSRPERVNIALSVAGHSFVAPMVLIRDAARRTIEEIAAEVAQGSQRARASQLDEFARLRRWGWLVPFAFLRRALLRFLLPRMLWTREDAPVFQVTGLADVDQVTPMMLLTAGILAVGGVREKPAVVDGRIAPRLQVTLTCCADHRVWDGRMASRFLNEVKAILESTGTDEQPPVRSAKPFDIGTRRNCVSIKVN